MVRRGVGLVVVSVAGLILVGCGGTNNDVAAETRQSTEAQASQDTNEAASPLPSETMTTSSTAPAPPRPTSCGTTTGPGDTEIAVTITTGWGNCEAAVALIDTYYRDRPSTIEDPNQALDIDGWQCASTVATESGPLVVCEMPRRAVVTAGTAV
jgi:hypothetical protein